MNMQDMQQEAPTDMSSDEMPCHSMGDEVAAEEESNNSCCEGGCDSCASVSATFNSQSNTTQQDYVDRYTQTVVLAYSSNHVKIPTPPPNS